jgi:TolA-binding protein
MGRKRSGSGQLVYFCVAQLIVLSVSGCAAWRALRDADEGRQAVQRARQHFARQEYDASVKENQRAVALLRNKPPADEAVFFLGLAFAHAGNPKKDNRAAVNYFARVVKEYPQSPWVDQAKAWIGVLQSNEKLTDTLEKSKQVDIEIEEKRRQKAR